MYKIYLHLVGLRKQFFTGFVELQSDIGLVIYSLLMRVLMDLSNFSQLSLISGQEG